MGEEHTGEEALALGAVAAGISMATSYPGSPSSGTMKTLVEVARAYKIHVEWCANERVALEMAIGASIAGRRALVCVKSVGMNVIVDPLMCLNLTGVNGGLVILLGDDPGAYGSQNEQDTRTLAALTELPMLEPASPSEGFEMMKGAFELSERFNIVVILRITRSFAQNREAFKPQMGNLSQVTRGYQAEPYRFVPYPGNAVAMHANLHQRLADFETWANGAHYNEIMGDGPKGILAAGFVHRKLMDVLGDAPPGELRILKLGCLHPLPRQAIGDFARGCEEILVLEETDPYVETQLKAALYDSGISVRVKGKPGGHVNWEGELFRWHIQEALEAFIPTFKPVYPYLAADEATERPIKVDHCQHYAYEEVLNMLLDVSCEMNQKAIITADPGCMVKVVDQLDAKYAIGSAVGIASGLAKAGCEGKAVAFYGDSAFFHSTIPAICNAAYNQSEVLMILLDNGGAASTGSQPSMSTGLDAFGDPAPKLSIPAIAQACGVGLIYNLEEDCSRFEIREAIKAGFGFEGLALVIVPVERGRTWAF